MFTKKTTAVAKLTQIGFDPREVVWALGSLSALHRKSFSAELLAKEFPLEPGQRFSLAMLTHASAKLGFKMRPVTLKLQRLKKLPMPLLIAIARPTSTQTLITQNIEPTLGNAASNATQPNHAAPSSGLALITAANAEQAVIFLPGQDQPQTVALSTLKKQLTGEAWLFAPEVEEPKDEDAVGGANMGAQNTAGTVQVFGFRWFVPELLRYKKVWRDVLLASLVLQLVALATPLFTQVIIDKVVVHRTQSTLIAIGIAMAIFVVFNGIMSWVRQYLLLHTGNRVDAVLGAAVWDHLMKLPLRYFEHRPTGVIAARLHAVETIREFVSGAAISLVLDLPFLVICLGVMVYYNAMLTAFAVSILLIIAVASLIMAPIFQRQLDEQFLLGARNQAFVTEHIAGFETVKSMQMESQLNQRYSGYLATFLASAFQTKQIANTYNTFANSLEQLMTVGILLIGAYIVMQPVADPAQVFTVGMLIAFQMFAGKLSQPVLRIVGLWTQFQQAKMSVERLGDIMNVPMEPYSLTPQRQHDGTGAIQVQNLAFSYSPQHPLLYTDLNLHIQPGQAIAIMGESGSGKSTLAKLMLGFYQPNSGSISIDGIDIRNLSANELRAYFGVVPQETILFSGTIMQNLQAGNPMATFDLVVQATKMAGIHQVIEQLPNGYQTEVGERGVGLSGGQKQRLAIARALLKRPKVLIFDEATSALDGNTAEGFAQTINQLKGKVTMLFITHALPKSLAIDAVLQLQPGGQATLTPVRNNNSNHSNKNIDIGMPPK